MLEDSRIIALEHEPEDSTQGSIRPPKRLVLFLAYFSVKWEKNHWKPSQKLRSHYCFDAFPLFTAGMKNETTSAEHIF